VVQWDNESAQAQPMGYYTIKGHHVFMTHEREDLARANALSAKDALFRVSTAFDSPERREADTLIFNYLESLYKADPIGFVQDWVTLALDAEQSAVYGWDLLYDYCCITKAARLADLRSEHGQMMGDLANDNFAYPMGKIFRLEALSRGWFFRRPTFGVTVNLHKIQSISGVLSSFVMNFDGLTLLCSSRVTASSG
jgi:hypothetical protein